MQNTTADGPAAPASADATVIEFPQKAETKTEFDRRWGKRIRAYGFTMVPSVLIHAQRRLGITPLQFNILIQLLDFWWRAAEHPRPPKIVIAERIGIHQRTVQKNIEALEKAGLILRRPRRSAFGDWHANDYDLSPLVQKLQGIEPELTKAREEKRALRKRAETPKGLRSRA